MRSPVLHALAGAGAGAGATAAALLGRPLAVLSERPAPRLTRLLVNVTVERSLWPVHVVLGADATVADLARAAVAAYVAEGHRPPLPADVKDVDAAARFELHLSKYSLDGKRTSVLVRFLKLICCIADDGFFRFLCSSEP
jgi:hypothetical protein